MDTQRGMESWAPIRTLTFGTPRTPELSALRAGRTLYPSEFLGTHFCLRLRGSSGFMKGKD